MDAQQAIPIFILILLIAYFGVIGYKVFSNLDAFKENSKQLLKNPKFWNPFKYFDITELIDTTDDENECPDPNQSRNDEGVCVEINTDSGSGGFTDGTLCSLDQYNNDNNREFTDATGVNGFFYKDGVCSEVSCDVSQCYTLNDTGTQCRQLSDEECNPPDISDEDLQYGEVCSVSQYPLHYAELKKQYENAYNAITDSAVQDTYLPWDDEQIVSKVNNTLVCVIDSCPNNYHPAIESISSTILCRQDDWNACSLQEFLDDHVRVQDTGPQLDQNDFYENLATISTPLYTRFDVNGPCIGLNSAACKSRFQAVQNPTEWKDSNGNHYNDNTQIQVCLPPYENENTQRDNVNNAINQLSANLGVALQSILDTITEKVNILITGTNIDTLGIINYLQADTQPFSDKNNEYNKGKYTPLMEWLGKVSERRKRFSGYLSDCIQLYNNLLVTYNDDLTYLYNAVAEHIELENDESIEGYISTHGIFGGTSAVQNICFHTGQLDETFYQYISHLCDPDGAISSYQLPGMEVVDGELKFKVITSGDLLNQNSFIPRLLYEVFVKPILAYGGGWMFWNSRNINTSLIYRTNYIFDISSNVTTRIKLNVSRNFWKHQLNFIVSVATERNNFTSDGVLRYSVWAWSSYESDPFSYGTVMTDWEERSSCVGHGCPFDEILETNQKITGLKYSVSAINSDRYQYDSNSDIQNETSKKFHIANSSDFVMIKRSPNYDKDIYIIAEDKIKDRVVDIISNNGDMNIPVGTKDIFDYIARFTKDGLYIYGEDNIVPKPSGSGWGVKYFCAKSNIGDCTKQDKISKADDNVSDGDTYTDHHYYFGNDPDQNVSIKDWRSNNQPHVRSVGAKHYSYHEHFEEVYLGEPFDDLCLILEIHKKGHFPSGIQSQLEPFMEGIESSNFSNVIETLLNGSDMESRNFGPENFYYTVRGTPSHDEHGADSLIMLRADKMTNN